MIEIPRLVGGLFAFVIGAAVGSFVGVVAYRMPRELSIMRPRSFCANCQRPIPWWANVPIVAYLYTRGHCVMCGKPIPFRFFLAELALASAALYLYLHFSLPDAIARFVFCAALFIVALIDFDWRLIPNLITFPGMPIGFLLAAFAMPEIGWKKSLIGIAVGGGVLFVTGELYRLVRGREGVGLGDVFLLGMTGAFLGWIGVLFTLFFGSMLGSVGGIAFAITGGAPPPLANPGGDPVEEDATIMGTTVPFGPFLALAAGIFALFQPAMVHWYLSR
ncbi:MAG: prepilin peptidase [Candidatus Binataceae bacterium]|nr:prepilin peptidase [Candidatus Binataceae bacterium]